MKSYIDTVCEESVYTASSLIFCINAAQLSDTQGPVYLEERAGFSYMLMSRILKPQWGTKALYNITVKMNLCCQLMFLDMSYSNFTLNIFTAISSQWNLQFQSKVMSWTGGVNNTKRVFLVIRIIQTVIMLHFFMLLFCWTSCYYTVRVRKRLGFVLSTSSVLQNVMSQLKHIHFSLKSNVQWGKS